MVSYKRIDACPTDITKGCKTSMFDFIHKVNYHQNPHTLHIGCEAPRAYFVPFHSETAALGGNRAASHDFLTLCGDWDFTFYPSLRDVPDITAPGFVPGRTDRIEVPRSWQTYLDRDYDTPQYVNVMYPVTVDPPFVPDANPCGLYRRTVTLPAALEEDFLAIPDLDYEELRVLNGHLFSGLPLLKLTPELLTLHPEGIACIDCACVTLDEALLPDDIAKHCCFDGCAMVRCSERQQNPVASVSRNVAKIQLNDQKDGILSGWFDPNTTSMDALQLTL